MKVFISWSGHQSHKVATVLRDWLPSVIQSIIPYVSSEDIDKGARWTTDIAGELNQSSFGILCVTKENLSAPWLNFEAGALGKSVDKSRVCPFLFRVKRSEVEGPILQFQSTIFEQDDVLKLVKSLNQSCAEHGIPETRLEKAFEVWWPALKKELDGVADEAPSADSDKKPAAHTIATISKILEEVLELSRNNQKLLRSPEELLPAPYLEKIVTRPLMREGMEFLPTDHPVWEDFAMSFSLLQRNVQKLLEEHKDTESGADVLVALRQMKRPLSYILRRGGLRRLSKRMLDELELL